MKKVILTATLIAAAAGTLALGPATGQTNADAEMQSVTWMSADEIVARLEARGYEVLEIEREDGRVYEVEMRDANGFEVEAYLDPATGEPVPYSGDDMDQDEPIRDDG